MSVMAGPNISAGAKKRKHGDDTALPVKKRRKSSEEEGSDSEEQSRDGESPRPPNKHTKKERKQNRSTRIHSLRKQLARGSLPSNIQQEKERELAALLHEQHKTKTRQEAKKTLEKYHYVRFIERTKAEKRLKQLRKQIQSKPEDEQLSRNIQEMEVNRNYAIYAPLDQKYISIFAPKMGKSESEHDGQLNDTQSEPPMWKVVKDTMTRGLLALEALRDSKMRGAPSKQTSSKQADVERPTSSTSKRKPTSQKAGREGTMATKKGGQAAEKVEGVSDDEMSDGGFFER